MGANVPGYSALGLGGKPMPRGGDKSNANWFGGQSLDDILRNITRAQQNNPGRNGFGSSAMAPMMALMGLGNMVGGPHRGGQYGGGNMILPYGAFGNGAGNGSGNGNNNGNDGNNGGNDDNTGFPGDKYPKNLIPDWWKRWYDTTGQYGRAPQVPGIL